MNVNRLLSLSEAAKLLGVSLRTLHRYIGEGRIPKCKIGKRASRIRSEDLDAFIVSSVHNYANPLG